MLGEDMYEKLNRFLREGKENFLNRGGSFYSLRKSWIDTKVNVLNFVDKQINVSKAGAVLLFLKMLPIF